MVAAVRAGASLRSVARRFAVGLRTVQRWVDRAGDARLDRVDWSDRSRAPHRVRRTDPAVEIEILELRRRLREESVLGEYGAAAIRSVLVERADPNVVVPSLRTIGRILERRGGLDARRRIRRPAPPPGWYLPAVADRRVELDEIDVIEGLRLKGGFDFDVLTAISLHGGLCGAWQAPPVRWSVVVDALVDHWRVHGLPGYAQFDNDTRFAGSHGYTDFVSPVMRLCLGLGVTPVFAPPRETGFQAAIESFNGRWQAKLWSRVWVDDLAELQARSLAYVEQAGRGPRPGSRARRRGRRFPRTGSSIGEPITPAGSSTCGGPTIGVRPAYSVGRSTSTGCGHIDWSGQRSTWAPASFGSSLSGVASRPISRS